MSLLKRIRAAAQSFRSIENPEVPLTSAEVLKYIGGAPAASGVSVNEQTALTLSAVWCAVRILAESVAVLPLIVYERTAEGKQRATGHPAYSVLHDRPNQDMTSVTFLETTTAHTVTRGNGYARIVRNGAGDVAELLPLRPDWMGDPRRNPRGRIEYPWNPPAESGGNPEVLDADEVLHIPGMGFDGIKGYSPIRMARESLGITAAAEQFNARFFSNGAWLGGVLEHPGNLSDPALNNLRASMSEQHTGAARAYKPMILEEGMKWNQVSLPQDDAMFLQLRKFSLSEIARWFRVPPHMLADLERATHSNIEHQGREFLQYTLAIWLRKWETELNRKLFGDSSRYYVEFMRSAFLQGDTKSRYEAYKIGREGGWLSVNDIRDAESMNEVEGGDAYLQPLNMGTVGEDGTVEEPAPDERSIDSLVVSFCPVFEDAISRCIRRQGDRIRRKSESDEFDTWISDYLDAESRQMVEALSPVVSAIRGASEAMLGYCLNFVWDPEQAVRNDLAVVATEAVQHRDDGTLDEYIRGWSISRVPALVRALTEVSDD